MLISRLIAVTLARASTYERIVKVLFVSGYTAGVLLFFGLLTGPRDEASDTDGPIGSAKIRDNGTSGRSENGVFRITAEDVREATGSRDGALRVFDRKIDEARRMGEIHAVRVE